MLGNDVIDLRLAKQQTRWKTRAFQQKVLHPLELSKYEFNSLSFIDFWKIWSIKESAYKAHQRKRNHPPLFNPFQILVELLSENRSKVRIGNEEYNIISYVGNHYIYSKTEGKESHSVQNFNVGGEHTLFLKNLNRKHLAKNLIKNANGIPFLVEENRCIPVSITHHGSYFAYSYAH
jgi:phosphopantetheinyl transferase (holo-ACP synthase)